MAPDYKLDDDHTVFDLDLGDEASDNALLASPKESPSKPASKAKEDKDLLDDLAFFGEETGRVPSPPEKAPAGAAPRPKAAVRSKKAEDDEKDPRGPPPKAEPNTVVQALESMPLEIVAVLGRQKMTVKEMANLRSGSVIELNQDPRALLDLVSAGKTIGKGELVLVDGRLGIRIVKYL